MLAIIRLIIRLKYNNAMHNAYWQKCNLFFFRFGKKNQPHKKRKLEANICWDISQNLDDMDQAYIDVTIKDIA